MAPSSIFHGGPIARGQTYRLAGHTWFCSAPMSDMLLILRQAPAGPTCFLVPFVLNDGIRNTIALQRLKDRLGNRSNASQEIELDGIWGVRLSEEGRGIQTILDMAAPPGWTMSWVRQRRCSRLTFTRSITPGTGTSLAPR